MATVSNKIFARKPREADLRAGIHVPGYVSDWER